MYQQFISVTNRKYYYGYTLVKPEARHLKFC